MKCKPFIAYRPLLQIMSCGQPAILEQLCISSNPKDYYWVSQGVLTVDNMDDKQEFDFTTVSHEEVEVVGYRALG